MTYDDEPEKRNAYMREYRARRESGNFEPRPRGRKPLNLGLLCTWEFEWYKAFHLLRDGTQLPSDPNFVAANERSCKEQLQWWKNAPLKEILGDMKPGTSPPFDELPKAEREKAKKRWEMMEWKVLKEFAEHERNAEIAALERWLKPKETPARAGRRQTWEVLANPAASIRAIEQACKEWKSLPDVRAHGVAVFADHVEANMEGFRRMKLEQRYPGPNADDSRLEYLARGMSGLMLGASPMTAIQHLRLMKHDASGPWWSEDDKLCRCWRCGLERSRRMWRTLRSSIEEGI
jgi:hypothetical protein